MSKNNPNANYAMYETDRLTKTKAKTMSQTNETFRDSHVRALEKQVIEYALQRDTLLAALRDAKEKIRFINGESINDNRNLAALQRDIDAAIAAAEKET